MSIQVSAVNVVTNPELFDAGLDLMVDSFRQAYSAFDAERDLRIVDLEKFLAGIKEHELEVFAERPSEIEVLAASCDGELGGMVILDRHEDGVLYIRQIATAPRFLRSGVARALVLETIRRRDGRNVRLVTRRINQASQGLFKSIGFEEIVDWSHPDYNPNVYLSMALS